MPKKSNESKLVNTKVEDNAKVDENDLNTNSELAKLTINPWGKNTNVASDLATKSSVKSLLPTVLPNEPTKYIPPSLRNSNATKICMSNKQNRLAPSIESITEFPALNNNIDTEINDGSWSKVTKKMHIKDLNKDQPPQQLSSASNTNGPNKYVSLSKREIIQNCNQSEMPKPVATDKERSKYIPPHLRKK